MESIARAFAEQRGLLFRSKVGAGAFKETFLVESGGEPVALKVIGEKSSPMRTQREIDALLKCHHPNIACLQSVEQFSFEGITYTCLLEDFLAGGTLANRIATSTLDRQQVLEVGAKLIDALAHTRPNDLVHRDIKPENIMFPAEGSWEPIIVDFGLVRDLSKSSLTQTWAPSGPGTPLYAPPEQLNNRKELIDWRSDQFSLGVTLVHAMGGLHPYASASDKQYECVDRVSATMNPDPVFSTFIAQHNLPALVKMVMPYPVQRFRTPESLAEAWDKQ